MFSTGVFRFEKVFKLVLKGLDFVWKFELTIVLDQSRLWIPTPGLNQSSRGESEKYYSPSCSQLQGRDQWNTPIRLLNSLIMSKV